MAGTIAQWQAAGGARQATTHGSSGLGATGCAGGARPSHTHRWANVRDTPRCPRDGSRSVGTYDPQGLQRHWAAIITGWLLRRRCAGVVVALGVGLPGTLPPQVQWARGWAPCAMCVKVGPWAGCAGPRSVYCILSTPPEPLEPIVWEHGHCRRWPHVLHIDVHMAG